MRTQPSDSASFDWVIRAGKVYSHMLCASDIEFESTASNLVHELITERERKKEDDEARDESDIAEGTRSRGPGFPYTGTPAQTR